MKTLMIPRFLEPFEKMQKNKQKNFKKSVDISLGMSYNHIRSKEHHTDAEIAQW